MFQPKSLVAMVMLAGVVLAACTTTTPQAGGSATAYLIEPSTLDPRLCGDTTCTEVVARLFDSLGDYDPTTAELLPSGASSWVSNDDDTVFTFTLREDATFHDGTPVTAADYVRSLTTAALKATASEVAPQQLDGITGFKAAQRGRSDELPGVRQGASETELIIELDAPNPDFINRVGHTIFSPLPPAAVDDVDAFREEPVGNGPYQMDGAWEHNEHIAVTQYADYTGDRAGSLEAITWQIFADVETAYTEFEGGDLDTSAVPPERIREAESTYGDGFVGVPTAGIQFLAANTTAGATANADFRRAVSLAINRDDIVDAVFDGTREAATSIIPPATPGHRADVCQYCEHDEAAAKAALQLAGGVPDEPVAITYVGAGTHDSWVSAVQAQLEETLGVETERVVHAGPRQIIGYLSGNDPQTGKKVDKISTGFIVIGWGQDFPGLENWLRDTLHPDEGGLFTGWSDDRFVGLLDDARAEDDVAARLALFQQAEDVALDQMPALPMWYDRTAVVYDTEVFSNFVVDRQLGIPAWEAITVA